MAKTNHDIKSIVSFLFEVGTLRKIARTHRQTLLTDDLSDNIATHSYRTTIIGYLLAVLEKADPDKVLKICLFHDIDEARSNDQNWIHKKYVKVFSEEITADQLKIPELAEIKKLQKEYDDRKTPESRIAKDADLLDQLFILREYEWHGNKKAARWLKGKENNSLSTPIAKRIAQEIKTQRPSQWWDSHYTNKRR